MFGKTREKLEAKYVEPVRTTMAGIAIVAVAAFLIALVALARTV